MGEVIEALSNEDAIRILSLIAKHELGVEDSKKKEKKFPVGLTEALEKEFDLSPATGPVSDGDMARQALLLLAHGSDLEGQIRARKMAERQNLAIDVIAHYQMDPITAIALPTACIMVLKSYLEISYNKKDGWKFKFKTKPLDKDLLKGFMEKLLGWIPKGPLR